MCKYACNCKHPTCVQAPEGCFILGWPCPKHNHPSQSAFTIGDIKSRDNDWTQKIQAGVRTRGLIEAGIAEMASSRSWEIYTRNKLERLSAGKKLNFPKAMDRWLAKEGYIPKPTIQDWRDPHFERFCADLRAYFEHEIENMPFFVSKIQPNPDCEQPVQEPSPPAVTVGKDNVKSRPATPSSTIDDDDKELDDIREFLLKAPKPPAWKPSPDEISVLLKTEIPEFSPPPSPTLSIHSINDTERPNPFRQRERHRSMYNLKSSSLTTFENMSFVGLDQIVLPPVEERTETSLASSDDAESDTDSSDDGIPADLANALSRPNGSLTHRPRPLNLDSACSRITFDRPRYSPGTLESIRMAGLSAQDLHRQFAGEHGLLVTPEPSRPASVSSLRTHGSLSSSRSSETMWSLHRRSPARRSGREKSISSGAAQRPSSQMDKADMDGLEEGEDDDVFLQLAQREIRRSSQH